MTFRAASRFFGLLAVLLTFAFSNVACSAVPTSRAPLVAVPQRAAAVPVAAPGCSFTAPAATYAAPQGYALVPDAPVAVEYSTGAKEYAKSAFQLPGGLVECTGVAAGEGIQVVGRWLKCVGGSFVLDPTPSARYVYAGELAPPPAAPRAPPPAACPPAYYPPAAVAVPGCR